jgi:hypothetical protein
MVFSIIYLKDYRQMSSMLIVPSSVSITIIAVVFPNYEARCGFVIEDMVK